MPIYEELLETDETLKRLNEDYDEQWALYKRAFAEDWPDKFAIEQEVARRGSRVAARWEELRRISQAGD